MMLHDEHLDTLMHSKQLAGSRGADVGCTPSRVWPSLVTTVLGAMGFTS